VRLVVQVEAVADELFQLDFGRAFETPVAAISAGAITARAAVSTGTITAWATVSTGSATAAAGPAATASTTAFAGGTALFLLFLLFCHVVNP
jgi:hypothetical protein